MYALPVAHQIVWRVFCRIRNKVNRALKNLFSLMAASIAQKLFQSLLTVPFWPFLPKILSEGKCQEIVTVRGHWPEFCNFSEASLGLWKMANS